MKKAELLQWLQEEQRQWNALLARIAPAQMAQSGVAAHWSMKDLIAHLNGWQTRLISRIQAAQQGQPEPPPLWPAELQGDDAVNAWIYATNHDRPLDDILAESEQQFQQLLAIITDLPDDVRIEADYRVIPWSTFTDPEVARVGLSEDEAKEKGIEVEVTKYGIDDLDRAIADSADHGFVKVLTEPGKDRILGATIVGEHAGDLLAEFVLAMKHGIGLNKLLGTIHIYPTMSEANKYAAGVWKRAHAPEGALRMAERFFAWRRR